MAVSTGPATLGEVVGPAWEEGSSLTRAGGVTWDVAGLRKLAAVTAVEGMG
jgi:hypothetical protein